MEFTQQTKIACDVQEIGETSIGVQMMKAIGESNHYYENYMATAVTSSQVQALFCACAGKALKSAHEFDAISGVKSPSVLGHFCIFSRPEEEGDLETFGELNAEKCGDLDGVAFSGVRDGVFYVFGGLLENGRFSLIRDGIEWTRIGANIFDGLEFAGVNVAEEIRKFHKAKLPIIPQKVLDFIASWDTFVDYDDEVAHGALENPKVSEKTKEKARERLARSAWKLSEVRDVGFGAEMRKAVVNEIQRVFG